MSETKETDYRAAFDAGAAANIQQVPVLDVFHGLSPYAVIPPGYTVHDVEKFAPRPVRTRHTLKCQNVETFCRYWDMFRNVSSVILADKNTEKPSFVAIFDFDSSDTPAWKRHAANYQCPISIEWRIWQEHDKRAMKQGEFAQFVEDNLVDIVDPDHATMLEASRSLVARRNVDFVESIRLENGARQFTYHEEIKGTTSRGTIEVPDTFVIAVPVFADEPKSEIEARLRYRIPDGGGHLMMWYELVRPQKVIEAAFADVVEKIKARTQSEILFGTIS